jgi:hypothetical protein
MKRIIVLFVLSALSPFIWGQHSIYLKGNIGSSKLCTDYSFSIEHQEKFCLSGSFGVAYNFQFSRNSTFGTDLLFIQIEGNEHSVTELIYEQGVTPGEMEMNTYRHISVIGLPVYYGYSFKNLKIKIGIQPSVSFLSSGRQKGHYSDDSGNIVYFNEIDDKLNLGTFNIGTVAGLGYSLTDKFSVEIGYYQGLNNIWKSDSLMKSKISQITVGVQYSLFSSANQK